MLRIPHLRVILESEPHPGLWNMAVDEALLETAICSDVATFRWYQWNEPTVSLGYFQKARDLTEDAVLSQLPAVHRLSGGGAILHDDELTYCVTLPATQSLYCKPHELYDIVHGAISDGLRQLGFSVTFRGRTLKQSNEPMLCFQRQDAHDITLSGKKILGSAQRRRRGAIMQHGSLIRRASPLVAEIPGLADLSHVKVPESLAEVLAFHVARSIAESWTVDILTVRELDVVREILSRKA